MSVDSILSKAKGEKEPKSEPAMPHKSKHKHGIKKTTIEHHDEGHVIKHEMDAGGDTTHAVADMDGVHDNLEQHLGEANEGEQAMPTPQGPDGAVAGTPPAGMPSPGA